MGFFLCFNAPAQISVQSYETPTCIDFETTEIRVSRGSSNVVVNLVRTGEFRDYTQVDFQTEAGTAKENEDFRATGGTLVFQPGEGYKSILIPLNTNSPATGGETFRILLSTSSRNTILAHQSATILIESVGISSAMRLAITKGEGNSIHLTWPKSTTRYLLESARGCGQEWQAVEAEPTLVDSRYQLEQSQAVPGAIYRLRAQ
jgi:hypothetical protein